MWLKIISKVFVLQLVCVAAVWYISVDFFPLWKTQQTTLTWLKANQKLKSQLFLWRRKHKPLPFNSPWWECLTLKVQLLDGIPLELDTDEALKQAWTYKCSTNWPWNSRQHFQIHIQHSDLMSLYAELASSNSKLCHHSQNLSTPVEGVTCI